MQTSEKYDKSRVHTQAAFFGRPVTPVLSLPLNVQ